MSAVNASTFLISVFTGNPVAQKTVAKQTDLQFPRSSAEIDVSNKQSGRYGESLPGRLSGEITFDAFIETVPGANEVSEAEMEKIYNDGSTLKWAMKSNVVGTLAREVFAYITNFTFKAQQETGASYSVTLKITGTPTSTTVA